MPMEIEESWIDKYHVTKQMRQGPLELSCIDPGTEMDFRITSTSSK